MVAKNRSLRLNKERLLGSHRLTVRTPPSHGGNRSSILLGTTYTKRDILISLFVYMVLENRTGKGSGKRKFSRVGKQSADWRTLETERCLKSPERS